MYHIHAERDFERLNLFADFQLNELFLAFYFERKIFNISKIIKDKGLKYRIDRNW